MWDSRVVFREGFDEADGSVSTGAEAVEEARTLDRDEEVLAEVEVDVDMDVDTELVIDEMLAVCGRAVIREVDEAGILETSVGAP